MRALGGIDVRWCADIDEELAARRAADLGIPAAGTPDVALGDQLGAAELVVNLTPPGVHAQVSTQILDAGKHVYVEKPLATSLDDAADVLALAERRDRLVGCAPDWILSGTCETAKSAIDQGRLGVPIGVTAFSTHSRVETWHANPASFFQPGAGPLLDIGPYYVSALVELLGPVTSTAAVDCRGQDVRPVTSPNRIVDSIDVAVPTHSCALLRFASGVVGTLTASFDAWERTMPFIEVYGTEGTLALPMPHERDGELRLKRHADTDWTTLPTPASEYRRGIGVVDMADAVRSGRAPRASGAAGFHVLAVLAAIGLSSVEQRFVPVSDDATRAAVLQPSDAQRV